MTDWSTWNWINVFFIFASGYIAITCFRDGQDRAGWLNLFASSVNGAVIATKFL